MATPPTLASYHETVWNTTASPKSVTFTPGNGNILAALSALEDSGVALNDISGGVTWTQQASQNTASNVDAKGATATGAGSSISPSVTRGANARDFGVGVFEFSGSDGVGAVASGTSKTGTHVTQSITTQADNSAIVVIIADWNATSVTGRTWDAVNGTTPTAGNGFEKHGETISGTYTVVVGYYPDAGTAGAKTVGITHSASMKATIIAIEVKGAAAGGGTNATATPSTVAATTTIGTPTLTKGTTATPATVAAVASVPTPTASTGTTATPSTVAGTASIPTPSISAGGSATAHPSRVDAIATVGTPTIQTGSTATPSRVNAVASIPTPTVKTGSTAKPAAVTGAVSIGTPTIHTGAAVPTWSLWDGVHEIPLTLQGVWNGTSIDALTFDEVTA